MMGDASSDATMATGASEISVKSRDKRELPQSADDEALGLFNRNDQDIRAFAFGYFVHHILARAAACPIGPSLLTPLTNATLLLLQP